MDCVLFSDSVQLIQIRGHSLLYDSICGKLYQQNRRLHFYQVFVLQRVEVPTIPQIDRPVFADV